MNQSGIRRAQVFILVTVVLGCLAASVSAREKPMWLKCTEALYTTKMPVFSVKANTLFEHAAKPIADELSKAGFELKTKPTGNYIITGNNRYIVSAADIHMTNCSCAAALQALCRASAVNIGMTYSFNRCSIEVSRSDTGKRMQVAYPYEKRFIESIFPGCVKQGDFIECDGSALGIPFLHECYAVYSLSQKSLIVNHIAGMHIHIKKALQQKYVQWKNKKIKKTIKWNAAIAEEELDSIILPYLPPDSDKVTIQDIVDYLNIALEAESNMKVVIHKDIPPNKDVRSNIVMFAHSSGVNPWSALKILQRMCSEEFSYELNETEIIIHPREANKNPKKKKRKSKSNHTKKVGRQTKFSHRSVISSVSHPE